MPWQLIEDQVGEIMDTQTLRYGIAVAALSTISLTALVIDGDAGTAIAIAAAGGVGYLAKDWRMKGGEDNAKEVPK